MATQDTRVATIAGVMFTRSKRFAMIFSCARIGSTEAPATPPAMAVAIGGQNLPPNSRIGRIGCVLHGASDK
jgi:hypothetical protein